MFAYPGLRLMSYSLGYRRIFRLLQGLDKFFAVTH